MGTWATPTICWETLLKQSSFTVRWETHMYLRHIPALALDKSYQHCSCGLSRTLTFWLNCASNTRWLTMFAASWFCGLLWYCTGMQLMGVELWEYSSISPYLGQVSKIININLNTSPLSCTVCLVCLVQTINLHIKTSCVVMLCVILFSLSPCAAQKQTSTYHKMPDLSF